MVADANRYVDEQAPWTLRKTDPARMETVLYVLAEVIRHLAILAQPLVPAATGEAARPARRPGECRASFAALATPLKPGTTLPKPDGVFPRFVEAEPA